jgi:hypothetical protein
MLSSITPLGERGRNRSWIVTVIAFTVGSVLAGGIVFGLSGLVGAAIGLPGQLWWVGLGLVGAGLVADAAGLRPPGPRRQVDENWLVSYRGWVVGLGYGLQLGSAFATIVPAFASWALLILAAFIGPVPAVLTGIAFGVGRSLLLIAGSRVHNTDALVQRMTMFTRWQKAASFTAVVAQAVVVALMVGAFQ